MIAPNQGRTISPGRVGVLVVLVGVLALFGVIGYRLMNPGAASSVVADYRINQQGYLAKAEPRPAPEFKLTGFDGNNYQLSQLRGKVVVINFWASTCPPCKLEAPALERTYQSYRDQGVVFLGVNVWDSGGPEKFMSENRVTYPNGTSRSTLPAEYGLTGIPETFVLDAQGNIVKHWVGPVSEGKLSSLIDEALASS